jgi:hypothetical protein
MTMTNPTFDVAAHQVATWNRMMSRSTQRRLERKIKDSILRSVKELTAQLRPEQEERTQHGR